MVVQWTPMRWPNAWTDPAALSLLQGTAIDYLLIGKGADLQAVRERALASGLRVADLDSPPSGISILKGEWPGVKMRRGGAAEINAGPTGVPWVDSNGWNIRLSQALNPETSVWVDAPPADDARLSAGSYPIAIADSAAHGGRWILSLDPALAKGLAGQRPEAVETWKRIAGAAGFFASHKDWPAFKPHALVGVISDFSGKNEFFSRELLNLLARAGQHYVILPKQHIGSGALFGLRAVIYPDSDAPADALRKQVHDFVQAGGLLIGAPQWGGPPGTPVQSTEGDRYSVRNLGKGRIALSYTDPDDPYLWAQDSVLLVSHRYDLVRFWNCGSASSYYAVSPDGKRAVVHLLFYANRGPDSASVRIAGRYREVKASTIDRPQMSRVDCELQKDAMEVHLPQVPQYVALELT